MHELLCPDATLLVSIEQLVYNECLICLVYRHDAGLTKVPIDGQPKSIVKDLEDMARTYIKVSIISTPFSSCTTSRVIFARALGRPFCTLLPYEILDLVACLHKLLHNMLSMCI